MRILVVGAGGIGGYFGGRLLQAGRDVRFLVRPARAAALAKTGLSIKSTYGDFLHPAPPAVTEAGVSGPVDLVLLSCKAYDLDDAIAAFAPAVGPETLILPLLNGMAHLAALDARFGPARVLGGFCQISVGRDAEGRILHFNDAHNLVCGDRNDPASDAIGRVEDALADAGFALRVSPAIVQEMWEKWVFIAACAGITCLMRSAIGDIVTAGGGDVIGRLFDECCAIAAGRGFPPSEAMVEQSRAILSNPKSALMASMLRDVERGASTEADHILGALLREGANGAGAPILSLAVLQMKAYDARRAREGG